MLCNSSLRAKFIYASSRKPIRSAIYAAALKRSSLLLTLKNAFRLRLKNSENFFLLFLLKPSLFPGIVEISAKMGEKYPPRLELSFPLQCNNIQLTLLLLGVRPLITKEPTIASILRQLDKCKARRHEPWSRG